jgi:hypothetical protein
VSDGERDDGGAGEAAGGAAGTPAAKPGAKKDGLPGFFVALLVFGGVVCMIALVGIVLVVRFLYTPEGKKLAHFVGDTAKLMQEAQRAPGTKELRALGCETAMVFDTDRMLDLMHDFDDAGARSDVDDKVMVTCAVGLLGTAPSCDDVARTYVGAVGEAKSSFRVHVQRQGGGRAECTGRYGADGAPISERSR